MNRPTAIVLFSGGLDSATALFWARVAGYQPVPVTFIYGQSHDIVPGDDRTMGILEAAGVMESHVVELPPIGTRSSPLTSAELAVPKDRDPRAPGTPSTYVPGRNLIFLSWAASLAEEEGAKAIVGGFNAVDYSGYPDCRREFLDAFEKTANLARAHDGLPESTRLTPRGAQFHVLSPFVDWTKAQVVRWGVAHGVPYKWTSSCYDIRDDLACGRCDACQLRLEAFQQAGYDDPIQYRSTP